MATAYLHSTGLDQILIIILWQKKKTTIITCAHFATSKPMVLFIGVK